MNEQPVHYAVVRDRTNWDRAKWTGLEPRADGALALARVPGTLDGKLVVRIGASGLSGIAIDDCGDLYLADTAQQRIVGQGLLCDAHTVVPGANDSLSAAAQFQNPRGLLLAHRCLYVADSGHGRVQILRLPSLEVRATLEGPLLEPIALAADSAGRIYVLDRGLKGVRRFDRWGVLDEGYTVTIDSPISLAIDAHDRFYVTSNPSTQIQSFDDAGRTPKAIVDPVVKQPRAMAAYGDRLYVADEASGEIWVFDAEAGEFLGTLPDYHGPVAALAVDQAGDLYVKPGLDDAYLVLTASMAYAAAGYVTAGPFDAGIGSVWERAHVDVDLPDGTDATLRVFAAATSTETPDWTLTKSLAPSLDILVANVVTQTPPAPGLRFLWMRVQLRSDDLRRVTPLLRQIQAETTAESYLNHLPAVYGRDDTPDHFLEHWLALFRAQLGHLELALTDMPRRFDPLTAPDDELQWLATWLGFDPPPDLTGDDLRKLLTRVHALYEQRGTPAGLRDFIELYTGVRPALFEAFRERHVWQLGYTSLLGCDTALAAGLPDGMIVPGLTLADPSYQGLRGDYYAGTHFNNLISHRIDPNIDFDASNNPWSAPIPNRAADTNPNAAGCFQCPPKEWSPSDDPVSSGFSTVRWTGQLTPSYSQRYTLDITTDGDVWFWLDGLLLIKPSDDPSPIHSAAVELEAGRWYAIQLDYRKKATAPTVQLFWSGRSQVKQVIPPSQFYSLRDEGASFELPDGAQTMLVGQTVVGESGPLDKADFGMPLFSETAHLFTISLPAAALPRPEQRELLQRIIEAEKPAHTDYHLCFVKPRMRVGFQACIGIDTIVAGSPEPMAMSGATLGVDSYLGDGDDTDAGRVGTHAHIGVDMVIGQRRQNEQPTQYRTQTERAERAQTQPVLLRQTHGRAPISDGANVFHSQTSAAQPSGTGQRRPVRPERGSGQEKPKPCGRRGGHSH